MIAPGEPGHGSAASQQATNGDLAKDHPIIFKKRHSPGSISHTAFQAFCIGGLLVRGVCCVESSHLECDSSSASHYSITISHSTMIRGFFEETPEWSLPCQQANRSVICEQQTSPKGYLISAPGGFFFKNSFVVCCTSPVTKEKGASHPAFQKYDKADKKINRLKVRKSNQRQYHSVP